jgi:endonuclease III-like uncharacterized protein
MEEKTLVEKLQEEYNMIETMRNKARRKLESIVGSGLTAEGKYLLERQVYVMKQYLEVLLERISLADFESKPKEKYSITESIGYDFFMKRIH